jgi:hypothetical protein
MNKHIELVKKWLADPESVSLEELEANNRTAAWDAWDVGYDWAAAATKATSAAYWAATDAVYRRNQANEYVKQYEELTK